MSYNYEIPLKYCPRCGRCFKKDEKRCICWKKEAMSWNDFEKACELIADRLKEENLITVYGIPRGGLPIAVKLSHLMDLKLIIDETKITYQTLIVDDIADTGKTLYPLRGHVIATLYYHQQSIVEPTIWIYEKTDKWILFPWEKG